MRDHQININQIEKEKELHEDENCKQNTSHINNQIPARVPLNEEEI